MLRGPAPAQLTPARSSNPPATGSLPAHNKNFSRQNPAPTTSSSSTRPMSRTIAAKLISGIEGEVLATLDAEYGYSSIFSMPEYEVTYAVSAICLRSPALVNPDGG